MRLALCIGIALAGCGEAAEPDHCGDGVCADGENSLDCRLDCPLVFCRCDATQYCGYKACFSIFRPNRYELVLKEAHLVSPRPDGSAWDADGPADPYLVVTRVATPTKPAAVLATSWMMPDTMDPGWDESGGSHDFDDPDQFVLEVFDEDGASDELMVSCELDASEPGIGLPPGSNTLTYRCGTPAGDSAAVWLKLQ